MPALGVIPARYASTRFPGKPLALLGGDPMVVHVLHRALEARRLDRVVVATDDERIAEAVRTADGEVRLTDPALPSGSDRVAAVVSELEGEGERYEVVVNIQGDEPFLPGAAIDRAVDTLTQDEHAHLATLAVRATTEEFRSSDVVKVAMSTDNRAVYFSRAGVPHPQGQSHYKPLKHVGLYVFRRDYLMRFVRLGVGALEQAEQLEQLRALEDGARIIVAVGEWPVLGVDTPQDLVRAEARLVAGSRDKRAH